MRSNHDVTYTMSLIYALTICSDAPSTGTSVLTSDDPALSQPPRHGDPGPVDVRLIEIVRETCKEKGAQVLEIEVMPDQVHLLV